MENLGLSFIAGLLAALSPCVLPALPIVVGSAASKRKWGPLWVALGLILSFTTLGFLIASGGQALGLNSQDLQSVGFVILFILGVAMLFPQSKTLFSSLGARLSRSSTKVEKAFSRFLNVELSAGLSLGLVRSPCIGPTLGSAIGLASQSETAGLSLAMMFLFALGSALPLLIMAYSSRAMSSRLKIFFQRVGKVGSPVFAMILILMGLSGLTDFSKKAEDLIYSLSPESWLDFVSRF